MAKKVLIEEAGQWWRMLSIRVQLLGMALVAAWFSLPEDQRASILTLFGITGEQMAATTALVTMTATIVARLWAQPDLRPSPPAEEGYNAPSDNS